MFFSSNVCLHTYASTCLVKYSFKNIKNVTKKFVGINFDDNGAVVVTQFVERSLPTPEVCSSNPVIRKHYLSTVLKLY